MQTPPLILAISIQRGPQELLLDRCLNIFPTRSVLQRLLFGEEAAEQTHLSLGKCKGVVGPSGWVCPALRGWSYKFTVTKVFLRFLQNIGRSKVVPGLLKSFDWELEGG